MIFDHHSILLRSLVDDIYHKKYSKQILCCTWLRTALSVKPMTPIPTNGWFINIFKFDLWICFASNGPLGMSSRILQGKLKHRKNRPKGAKNVWKKAKMEFLDLKYLDFGGVFLSGIGGYPPPSPPLTENHPAQKPVERGVPPPLTEKIC